MKFNIEEYPGAGWAASFIIHALIVLTAGIIINASLQQGRSSNGYVRVAVDSRSPGFTPVPKVQEPAEAKDNDPVAQDKGEVTAQKPLEPAQNIISELSPAGFYNFTGNNTDTTGLENVYNESTLNVSIKYPSGWTFIDQNVKKKLDGVTFIAASGSFNPPPYVHLAVMDKDLFIESRYKYKIETDSYIAYYNDPNELAGQVSQIFYLRTETDEDYTIKFIMNGREAFKALQPTFFGMVKSFKFGHSWF